MRIPYPPTLQLLRFGVCASAAFRCRWHRRRFGGGFGGVPVPVASVALRRCAFLAQKKFTGALVAFRWLRCIGAGGIGGGGFYCVIIGLCCAAFRFGIAARRCKRFACVWWLSAS